MKTLMGIVLVTLSLFAAPAFATCDITYTGDLPDSVVAEMRAQCMAKLAEHKKAIENPLASVDVADPEALSQWGVVAQEWAKALGVAAKELGIAANDFLGTDAGKLTAAVIIWQVAGETLFGIIIGIPLLILVIVVGLKMSQKALVRNIEYSDDTNWRGKSKVKNITYYDADDRFMPWLVRLFTLLLSIWIIAGVIL